MELLFVADEFLLPQLRQDAATALTLEHHILWEYEIEICHVIIHKSLCVLMLFESQIAWIESLRQVAARFILRNISRSSKGCSVSVDTASSLKDTNPVMNHLIVVGTSKTRVLVLFIFLHCSFWHSKGYPNRARRSIHILGFVVSLGLSGSLALSEQAHTVLVSTCLADEPSGFLAATLPEASPVPVLRLFAPDGSSTKLAVIKSGAHPDVPGFQVFCARSLSGDLWVLVLCLPKHFSALRRTKTQTLGACVCILLFSYLLLFFLSIYLISRPWHFWNFNLK